MDRDVFHMHAQSLVARTKRPHSLKVKNAQLKATRIECLCSTHRIQFRAADRERI